jgi:catechol 2,3-dioxygenase-like lactoylglutathione lyase family enzyme
MLDHIGLAVADIRRSKAFFTEALAPLAISVLVELTAEQTGQHAHAGFGKDNKAFFWIGEARQPTATAHIAFTAGSRSEVDAFHAAALRAGGTDNGAPGIRAYYHPDYYGAFVLDPDGNNIEAVCHRPE